MSSIKGLAEKYKKVHNFSITNEDGIQLDFSLREPSGLDETIDFVDDFRKTSKQINTKLKGLKSLDDLSMEERFDIIDGLFETKFTFCVKWLQKLSVDTVTEDDCIKAYELVGGVDSGEEQSLFYNIVQACGLLETELVGKDDEEDKEDPKDFTS